MTDIYLIDLVCGISAALDYVSPAVNGHHRRVGMACALLGREMGLTRSEITDLLMAGLLHDIGAFTLELNTIDGLDFDAHLEEHSRMGYKLLQGHAQLELPASLILNHHTKWDELSEDHEVSDTAAILSNVVNLSDRMDILLNGRQKHDPREVRTIISQYTEELYAPDVVKAFMRASTEVGFWDMVSNCCGKVQKEIKDWVEQRVVPHEQLIEFSNFFSKVIDFRSRHTATHSQGVAETAVQLARLAGMDDHAQHNMRLAGNLHDIGKLGVSSLLLDKPAKLTPPEYDAIKDHALVCELVLRNIPGLDEIADWACQHHERLNGKGYPHGLSANQLSLGSRIMQVADVHTAITEDRPYRSGMKGDKVIELLHTMANSGYLDRDLVGLASDNHEQIDAVRQVVQFRASRSFDHFNAFDNF